LHAINTHEVRSLPDAYEFDAALWDIVRRGLTKNRDDRWQNARDLMLELAAWLRAQGTTEDITGTALQGRGLGRFSSTPSFGAVHGESGTKSKGRATAMLEANIAGDCQRLADAMVHSGSARPIWRRLLVTRSPLFWGTVAAVFFLSLLFGFWVQRTSGPSPAPTQPSPPRHLPAAETAPLAAPQHPASEATSVTSPAARASNDAAASSGPAPTAERSTAPRPKARPPRGPSAQKEKSESPPSRALAPTRATKPAFKNPFD
jgi:serine/threonine-protein kinase